MYTDNETLRQEIESYRATGTRSEALDMAVWRIACGCCRRWVRVQQDRDDLAAEIWCRVVQRLDRIETTLNIFGYITATARRCILTHYRDARIHARNLAGLVDMLDNIDV